MQTTINRASGAAVGFIIASLIFIALVVGGEIFRPRCRRLTPTAHARTSKALAEIRDQGR